jgi:hypothetical protein
VKPNLSSDGWFRRVSVTRAYEFAAATYLDYGVPLAYCASVPAQLITIAETPCKG